MHRTQPSRCNFNGNREVKSALKALRLVSPRFTYLKRIQQILFAKIQITPTPTHLKSLEDADISGFGPYVREVNFVTPLHSCTIGYDTFEEIVVAQAIARYASGPDLLGAIHHESAGADGRQKYINKLWNGVSPFSEEQIQAGFRAYRTEAEEINTLLHSHALRAAWTRVLQTLPFARTFHFSGSEWWDEYRGVHLPVQPDCVVRPHRHDELHTAETCGKGLAVVSDAVFAASIACLSEAGVEVEALEVACIMTTSFGWEDLPGWKSLNLTLMRRFEFEPQNGSFESGCVRYDENHDASVDDPSEGQYRRANEAVVSVMKKSASHLESFKYPGWDSPTRWPGEEIIFLPRLLCLDLRGCVIEATGFKKWMAGMPSLQELGLMDVGVAVYFHEWLNVLDAIRHHPKRMKVWLSSFSIGRFEQLNIDYRTGEYEKFLEMEEGHDWKHDNNRSLALYLSGKGGYNQILREMLENDVEPSEDELSEDGEDSDGEGSNDD